MNDTNEPTLDDLVGDWSTLPDVAEALDLEIRRVRGLVADRHLVGVKRGERTTFQVPTAFLVTTDEGTRVLETLRGTATVLQDAGFDDAEALRWLFTEQESLGTTPIAAMRAGRRAEVRRLAQALA
ncbi:Rv2175c family DNA-binding protein [Isoptericola dokdonensis]|uniref:DNA-binding protein n=1 Tax=Isoptericola dokdonensis DS-3 TaxID=1300344 RepID=A0A168EFY8_9MICO|nr:Rv2175c family DNA-binding protein [Isoptericola dokdonensis]ANC29983.1 DNA-binding protein [Isoptericola dokdonensis DS-3]